MFIVIEKRREGIVKFYDMEGKGKYGQDYEYEQT